MLYRIITEDKNSNEIEKIVNKFYPGFTLIKGKGYWRLQKEKTLIIEIITDSEDTKINRIAKEIKKANSQEAVLIQRIKNAQWYV